MCCVCVGVCGWVDVLLCVCGCVLQKAAVIIEEDEDFKPARPIGGTRGKPQVQKGKAVPGTSPGGQRTKRARAVIKDDSG